MFDSVGFALEDYSALRFMRDSARRLNWSELVSWVDAVAASLHDAGLRLGDRISMWLPSRVETVVVLLACSRNGWCGAFVPSAGDRSIPVGGSRFGFA